MSPQLVVDIDLTLYSLAEFLASHPGRVDHWAQALWRFNEGVADRAIEQALHTWENAIIERILYLNSWIEAL